MTKKSPINGNAAAVYFEFGSSSSCCFFFREFVCFYDIMALPDAERWRGAPLNRLALLPDPLVIA